MEAIDLTNYDWIDDSDYNFTKKKNGTKKKGTVKKNPTVFVLSTLTFEQDTYLANEISRGTPDGDIVTAVFGMGISEVKNLTSNGKVVKFERDKDSDIDYPGDLKPWKSECLSLLPVVVRLRLQLQIRLGKQLNPDERKN